MKQSSPETQIVGKIPIAFSFEALPLILEPLIWPESTWLWNGGNDGRILELGTILTPTKKECDVISVMLAHITDLTIVASNGGDAYRNNRFNPHDPWRMTIEMKQRQERYTRYLNIEHLNGNQVSITDTRGWSGSVGNTNMSVERRWHRSSGAPNILRKLLDIPKIISGKEAKHNGRDLSPIQVRVWGDRKPETYMWLDEDSNRAVAWTGSIEKIETRSLELDEQIAWEKAKEISWGTIDFSLLNILSQLRG